MTEQLPWERFPTPAGPPASVPPPVPAPVLPPRPPNKPLDDQRTAPAAIDWHEVLDQAWPVIREQAIDYAKGTVGAIVAGQTVDLTHPSITVEDMTGRELVVADAKSRSWRTLIQGLVFDVFAGIIAAVAMLSGLDPFRRETWAAFGVLLLKSVVSAVISYFMRLKVTPTIKTPGEKMAVIPIPRPIREDETP